jgi:hypothetical protein
MQEMEMRRGNSILGRGARLLEDYKMRRGMVFGVMILGAMLAFELFNYSTTDFALTNLLGDLRFVGIRWATILAIAFCGMDFAGIARLFTPEKESGPHTEVWYLMAAWFLAATMNAMLTWWGVSLALLTHPGLGNEILSRATLLSAVPVFVSVLVWVIRILLIGTLSMAGNKLFSQMEDVLRSEDEQAVRQRPSAQPARVPTAAWSTDSHSQRPTRMIGAHGLDDEFTVKRPQTLAEKHGHSGRAQQPARQAAPPPPPAAAVRSVPKPANGQPARKPVTAGHGSGNGHGHGNGQPSNYSYHGLDED